MLGYSKCFQFTWGWLHIVYRYNIHIYYVYVCILSKLFANLKIHDIFCIFKNNLFQQIVKKNSILFFYS